MGVFEARFKFSQNTKEAPKNQHRLWSLEQSLDQSLNSKEAFFIIFQHTKKHLKLYLLLILIEQHANYNSYAKN